MSGRIASYPGPPMKTSRPSRVSVRSSRSRRRRVGAAIASAAISGSDGNVAADAGNERPALVVEREITRVQRRDHALPGFERPGPPAALAGGDPAVHARRPDGDDDVEVAPAELGVDEQRRERERSRRRAVVVRRREAYVLG